MGLPVGWSDPERADVGDWPGWPAPPGPTQHDYEPPRTTDVKKNRPARLRALGNAVVPQQIAMLGPAMRMLWGIEDEK